MEAAELSGMEWDGVKAVVAAVVVVVVVSNKAVGSKSNAQAADVHARALFRRRPTGTLALPPPSSSKQLIAYPELSVRHNHRKISAPNEHPAAHLVMINWRKHNLLPE